MLAPNPSSDTPLPLPTPQSSQSSATKAADSTPKVVTPITEAPKVVTPLPQPSPGDPKVVTPIRPDPIPDYALKYAPLVHLNSKEKHWPSSVVTHVKNSTPTRWELGHPALLLTNPGKLAELKEEAVNSPWVYLKNSTDPRVNEFAESLTSVAGKPDDKGHTSAESWILVVDKSAELEAPGYVDVFYFFFYPYNYGNKVVGIHFGNHVGDWEHVMIRFLNGVPQAVHLSAHADGDAYVYSVLEKKGDRPVVYAASGSHAFYPTKGKHFYTPASFLGPIDNTEPGPLWDPTLNYVCASCKITKAPDGPTLHFTPLASTATTSEISDDDIVSVLNYVGKWGDSFSDFKTLKPKQTKPSLGQAWKGLIWSEGPTGPRDKSLDRKGMNRGVGSVKDRLNKPLF